MSDTEQAAVVPRAAAAAKSVGAWVATALRPITSWSFYVAAGSVLAATAVGWTLISAAAWALQQVTVPDQIQETTGAYLALVVLASAVAAGTTGGRRLRYYRRERAAEWARWTASQLELDAALAAKRAEPAKTPKPALPRPLGAPLS